MFRKLAGLTAVAGLFIAGTASAAVSGSAHDFSTINFSSGNSTGEVCKICHAPHSNVNTTGLLWNHASSTTLQTGYTVYSSTTLDGTAGNPGDVSYLCLGCHDGTVAVDAYGGQTVGSTFVDNTTVFGSDAPAKFGTALSDDHQIGISYNATSDPELRATTYSTYTMGSGVTASSIAADFLYDSKVECASCHDVHNNKSVGNPTLLLVDNADSNFCLVCHNK
jgi:predicted CXXCH cytochrome family protein